MKSSNLIGIDVSDSSIKVLQLDSEKNIFAYGTQSLPEGVVSKGRILNKEAFAATLMAILKNTKPHALSSESMNLRAVLCLPESKLFTHYMSVPESVKKGELETFIKGDAEKIIPFNLDEMYWDYHVAEKDKQRNATFIGVAKVDLDNYVEAFSHANIKPAFVGGELFSLGKALLPDSALEEDHIILDIGAHTTTIGIFADDAVANASVVVPIGGDYFTEMVSKALDISIPEAEKQKREFGVDPESKSSEVTETLSACVMQIIGELNEAKVFFEKKTGNPIARIIVAGGSALLPGICAFIQKNTGIETSLADPLKKIPNHAALEEGTPSILFANVAGLALYGTHADGTQVNLLTQYRYQESDSQKELLSVRDVRSIGDLQYVIFMWRKRIKDRIARMNALLKSKFKIKPALILSLLFLAGTLYFLGWVILKYM
jgi:type IV pilus assembly protein PilM